MRGIWFFSFATLLSVTSVEAETSAPPLPQAMAVLGDSMSEGMLAGYSLEKLPSVSAILNILWLSSDSDQNQRMLSYRKKLARPDLSWATGQNTRSVVKSHAQRILELQPDLKVANFAISGDESYRLDEQVNNLLAREAEQKVTFDYVTILIGANDLGTENNDDITSPVAYVGFVEAAVRRLLERDPNRSILFVGLPDIHNVFEESADFVVVNVWGEKMQCKQMRSMIHGKRTVFYPENPEAYEFTKVTMAQYIEGLAGLVNRLSGEFADGRFKFFRDFPKPFNLKKALSIDCFHPSEWGQAELAEMTWNGGFWPSLTSSDFSLWKQTE